MTLRFGFETEVQSGADALLVTLNDMGLASVSSRHAYHCNCQDCKPDRTHGTFTCQDDCTVDGEFITRILEFGSTDAEDAIEGLGEAMRISRSSPGDRAGNHVHVDMTPAKDAGKEATTTVGLMRMFLRYKDDLGQLAAGRSRSVRNYNAEPGNDRYGYGGRKSLAAQVFEWLPGVATVEVPDYSAQPILTPIEPSVCTCAACRDYDRRYGSGNVRYNETYPAKLIERTPTWGKGNWLAIGEDHMKTAEFRLWNSTRTAWRIRMYVGCSVAMMNTALEGDAIGIKQDDDRHFLEVVGPYMDSTTLSLVLRQMHWRD